MSHSIALLTRYLRPHAFKVGLLGACLIGSIGLQLFIPQIIRSFIDVGTAGGAIHVLVRLALLYLSLAVLSQLLSGVTTYLSADVGWSATNLLRADLFRHTLDLDRSEERRVGQECRSR